MRLKFNRRAFREILHSPGVGADLSARTGRVAAAAGPGFVGDVVAGKSRLRGGVVTATAAAARASARDNVLVKALDAGR